MPYSLATSPLRLLDFLWPLHETPVHRNRLVQNGTSIQSVPGRTRLLVRLVLDECVALEEAGAPIQIQVDVLDVAVLAKLLLDVVFLRLFVD